MILCLHFYRREWSNFNDYDVIIHRIPNSAK